jgi:hypothetical protein
MTCSRPLLGLFSGELLSHIIPRWLADESSHDRARSLEYAWEVNWSEKTNTRIDDLYFNDVRPSGSTDQPELVLLTTSTATGERMAVSHFSFPIDPKIGPGISIRTLAEQLPDADIPLATAAFMSARFPIVSPPARLPGTGEVKRYVDGGYFENSGVSTVIDMLHALQPEAAGKADFLVVRIENGDVEEHKHKVQWMPFVELRQPLNALLLASDARAERAISELDQQQQTSAVCKSTDIGCTRIRQAVFQLHFDPSKPKLPLGWFISGPVRAEIASEVGHDNQAAFDEVAAALKANPE